jgi:hypothetical protein
MIIDDQFLLSELNELVDTSIHEHLKKCRNAAILRVKVSATDRMANIATGEMQALDELIEAIETAKERLTEKYEAARNGKQDMSKVF